jgi:hypothetical protein
MAALSIKVLRGEKILKTYPCSFLNPISKYNHDVTRIPLVLSTSSTQV